MASYPYALRIAFMATSHGLLMISAVTVASTPFAGMIVRPEKAANAASTSRMSAFSHAIVMGCCGGCCCCENTVAEESAANTVVTGDVTDTRPVGGGVGVRSVGGLTGT